MAETNGYQRRLYTSMDIGQAVDELVYHRVPSHVTTIGLVVTKQPLTGWRGWTLRLALWILQRAGHVVVYASTAPTRQHVDTQPLE